MHSGGQLTILVVEDQAVVRNVMLAVLTGEKYRVLEADSEAEALEVSATFAGAIELLIADHTLKSATGCQVARQIRRSRPDIKVLHISGYPIETLAQEEGLIAGAEFLSKPFLPKALASKVKQILACQEASRNK